MLRVSVFGSYYRGYCVLSELLSGPLSDRIKIVGVATDDPSQSFVSPSRRVWQYEHTAAERILVRGLAQRFGLDLYEGKVKTPEFHSLYEDVWKPDLCVSATFGQRIDSRIYGYCKKGFYNLHPCDLGPWPSRYAGPNPFKHMLEDGMSRFVIRMHEVDDGFDTGRVVATSEPVYIPEGATVQDLHKMSAPIAALLVRNFTQGLLGQPVEADHTAAQ